MGYMETGHAAAARLRAESPPPHTTASAAKCALITVSSIVCRVEPPFVRGAFKNAARGRQDVSRQGDLLSQVEGAGLPHPGRAAAF